MNGAPPLGGVDWFEQIEPQQIPQDAKLQGELAQAFQPARGGTLANLV